jgi:hypothetical protein
MDPPFPPFKINFTAYLPLIDCIQYEAIERYY